MKTQLSRMIQIVIQITLFELLLLILNFINTTQALSRSLRTYYVLCLYLPFKIEKKMKKKLIYLLFVVLSKFIKNIFS
jgi:hypothetical protein